MDDGHWLNEYRQALERVSIRAEDCDETALAHHLPFLRKLDEVDGSSIALFDMRTRTYRFLTSSFKFLGGYPREEAAVRGPDYFFGLMHEEDREFVMETTARTFRFLFSVPAPERRDYRLSFEFRIKAASGALVRLVQQIVVLELDARGNIWLVLVVNDLAPRSPGDDPLERRLTNTKTGGWYLFPPNEGSGGREDLSPRETEILGLVAAGMASREIADRLCISVATVNNHRQRILEKLGTRSSAGAVRYAASLGII